MIGCSALPSIQTDIKDKHAGSISWPKRRRGEEGKEEAGEEGEGRGRRIPSVGGVMWGQ